VSYLGLCWGTGGMVTLQELPAGTLWAQRNTASLHSRPWLQIHLSEPIHSALPEHHRLGS
jgi:hypothetical protein